METLIGGVVASGDGEGVLLALLMFGGALLLATLARAALRRGQRLTPPEVQERLDAGLQMVVLDTRPPELFANGHIATALNVPLPELRGALHGASSILPAEREQLVVVVAETGTCSRRCVDRLRRAGYTRVCVVEGGMQGWCADRLPLCQRVEPVVTGPR